MNDTTITLVGNLVEDPHLTIGERGVARARFRLASTSRRLDRESNSWVDGATLFMTVTAWRSLAEHSHDSLRKGDRVVVHGRLRRREWTTADGQARAQLEVDADAIGPDLLRGTVTVDRSRRGSASAARAEVDGSGTVAPDTVAA